MVKNMLLPNTKEERSSDKREYQRRTYEIGFSLKGKYQGLKFHLKTYGCQMNEHDSENIVAMLEELGFEEVEDYQKADLILLNTCSIRENAHNKAFGMLGRIKHLKESNPNLIVGLCGCMAQEEKVVEEILTNFKWLNFVFGTHNLSKLPEILNRSLEEKRLEIEVYSREQDLVEDVPVHRASSYKAYVNIIYGCDKFCTYCIVPYTRGRQHSRCKEDILKEVKELVKEGYQEVTLLGQNVNAYGKDLYETYNLGDLLEEVAKTNIPRIRFVTSHPWDFTDEMIEVIAKYPNIMPAIHLPVQSGSSRILKLMGRRYTRESYLKLYHKMKKMIPNCAISTDIIVAFPGETEEDFLETLSLAKECQYDNAFTFIYSPREGTPAAKLPDNTSQKEKEERLQRLNEVVNQSFLENNLAYVGKTVPVLIEGTSSKKENHLYGYSDTNKLINVIGDTSLIGKIVPVKITEAKTWSLDGEACESRNLEEVR